ncbi:MAG: NADH-quinone oxidoreductase subunit L [Chloroflexi bacterium]|nr:NADH-quinone oxidoreductase subunit L [Chloroflexota bacterium]
MFEVVWLIPFAPLLGFVVNGVAGRRIPRATGWISTGAILGSFVLTVALWIGGITADQPGWTFYPWVDSGTFAVNIGFLLDPLAVVMLLVVTGVSALVALYSVGYMDHDAAKSRFHTWIPLFVFSMVMLVMSDNLLQLFIFWEMVGLCSYLLIGYWHDRHSANIAATKAFLVNRIGDFGFIIGIVLAFFHFDTLRYREIFEVIGDKDPAMTTAIAFLLFIGAMGKSAQFPLHVWLPDAMEGPTPVSALIHAATMVTAGVYIVARMNPLYTVSPEALIFVAAIGTVTAFVAATIALVQTDIKRVLAYSTVSQLGLMFVALGAGAYSIAIFHLATHAFFKALLFLGSGSVIHALNDEQDMRQMGGLWRKMPLTYGTFLLGGLALAAVFPLAGFWSKDEILASAFLKATAPAGASLAADHGAGIFWLFFIVGLVVSLMTAFYTLRMILMTFHGKPRNQALHDHAHESPWVMTLPLGILAIGAVVAGAVLGIPPEHGFLHEYLYKTAGIIHFEGAGDPPTVALAVISTLVALSGVAIAFLAYRRGVPIPDAARRLAPGAEKLFQRKWYMDHLGDGLMVMLTRAIAVVSWGFDAGVIDGLVNASGAVTRRLSGEMQRLQTGQAQNYALLMVVGIVLVIGGLMIFGGNAT